MEDKELKDITIAAVVLAVAFGISNSIRAGGLFNLSLTIIFISFITVSIGFILHELGHRFVARALGAFAEFRVWKTGLYIAIISSFFGFIFAAPGAVYISPRADLWGRKSYINSKVSGITAITGPLINLLLAAVFFIIGAFAGTSTIAGIPISMISAIGVNINVWLALFNLIPFPPLDGSKVIMWDKNLWTIAFATTIILFIGLQINLF